MAGSFVCGAASLSQTDETLARQQGRNAGRQEFKAGMKKGAKDEGRNAEGGKAKARRECRNRRPSTFSHSSLRHSCPPCPSALNSCRPAFLPSCLARDTISIDAPCGPCCAERRNSGPHAVDALQLANT